MTTSLDRAARPVYPVHSIVSCVYLYFDFFPFWFKWFKAVCVFCLFSILVLRQDLYFNYFPFWFYSHGVSSDSIRFLLFAHFFTVQCRKFEKRYKEDPRSATIN